MFEELFKTIADTGNELVWKTPETFPWLIAVLLFCGIFITFRMGWINIRRLKHGFDVIRGRYDNPKDGGDINHFQALTTALSATVGIGNIAGVATAIHYGGPGVIFWLWISGIFGMTLKFAECALSMHYRKFDDHGKASGGPMYTIERGLGKSWKWLAVTFAVLAVICSFATGNMNQANTVAVSCADDFGLQGWIVGVVLAFTAGLVILGGIKRIGAVSSKLMPAMAILYTIGALTILFSNPSGLPGLFSTIVREAFSPSAAIGGTAVGAWSLTLLWGIRRALFSNEAGQGSAPIAHAAAKTKEPIREGVVAMLGPLVDTLTICTITGLVIISQGVWDQKHEIKNRPLELNKIEVLKAPNRIYSDRDLNAKDAEELPKFKGELAIEKGVAKGILFKLNDSLVDDARLMQGEVPFTGNIKIEGFSLTDTEGESLDLSVNGRALLHSSALTAKAFKTGFQKLFNLGWLGNLVVTISVILFALSTIISWSYYGDRCVEYLFGVKYVKFYRMAYICFTYLGTILALETVWAFGDLALGLMSLPNLFSVLLLSPVLVKLTKEYFSREQKPYK